MEQLKILQSLSTTEKIEKFVLSMTEKKIIVKTDDIIYLKADNVYTEFYLDEVKYVVSKLLKEYENLLNLPNFYKRHRSYIINIETVKSYSKAASEIEMSNNQVVNLARDKKKEFEEKFK